jgi:hypothetical protein
LGSEAELLTHGTWYTAKKEKAASNLLVLLQCLPACCLPGFLLVGLMTPFGLFFFQKNTEQLAKNDAERQVLGIRHVGQMFRCITDFCQIAIHSNM